jgi:hypothetical protein
MQKGAADGDGDVSDGGDDVVSFVDHTHRR